MTARLRRLDEPHIYGAAAAFVGAFLLWYAAWTLICNVLVLSGAHFAAIQWGFAAATIVSAPVIWRYAPAVARAYAWREPATSTTEGTIAGGRASPLGLGLIAAAFAIGLIAAQLGYRTLIGLPYILGCGAIALLLWTAVRRGSLPLERVPLAIGWRLPVLLALLFGIYFFSHRIDGDDANFVNLASAAQRTAYGVFQVDTMLGDGPHPIHLPSYKFHSFELVGAVLASWLHLPTIAVLHLILPALQIPVLAAVLLLVLGAAAGRLWLAASLFWLAFLFLNEISVGGYGLHGLIRFYQGKGFLVSVLLPLIAVLTARWMTKGERIDLAALLLANICAIGFSANGIYGGPVASGFVAAAFLATRLRDGEAWRRAAWLLPTFAWSAVAMALIVVLKLAYPSEIMEQTYAMDQLGYVAWYGIVGRLTLAAMAMMAIGILPLSDRGPALVYMPVAMLLTLNPASWALIGAVTGNLGFRIFWSIPAAFLIALTCVAVLRWAGLRAEAALLLAGAAALLAAIGYIGREHSPVTEIRWHAPDLKVIRPDYELAQRIAARTRPECSILAPEHYTMLLSMLDGTPRPVFVRTLYLTHYRFTMPPAERALRNRLRLVVDGPVAIAPPTRAALDTLAIPIGTVAVRADAPSFASAREIAGELALAGPVRDGPLLIWSGRCRR